MVILEFNISPFRFLKVENSCSEGGRFNTKVCGKRGTFRRMRLGCMEVNLELSAGIDFAKLNHSSWHSTFIFRQYDVTMHGKGMIRRLHGYPVTSINGEENLSSKSPFASVTTS